MFERRFDFFYIIIFSLFPTCLRLIDFQNGVTSNSCGTGRDWSFGRSVGLRIKYHQGKSWSFHCTRNYSSIVLDSVKFDYESAGKYCNQPHFTSSQINHFLILICSSTELTIQVPSSLMDSNCACACRGRLRSMLLRRLLCIIAVLNSCQ